MGTVTATVSFTVIATETVTVMIIVMATVTVAVIVTVTVAVTVTDTITTAVPAAAQCGPRLRTCHFEASRQVLLKERSNGLERAHQKLVCTSNQSV